MNESKKSSQVVGTTSEEKTINKVVKVTVLMDGKVIGHVVENLA